MDYAGLQSTIGDFLNRPDLYAQVPTFITLAEAKMARRLRVQAMVTSATASVGAEFETTPTDFAAPISMKLTPANDATGTYVLDCIAPDAMAARKQFTDTPGGQPKCYAVVGGSFEFSPVPDQSYSVYLIYYAKPPALSVSNTSNWLLAAWPDAYLYGALEQATPYVKDARAAAWASLFEAALSEIEQADKRDSFGARLEPKASLVI